MGNKIKLKDLLTEDPLKESGWSSADAKIQVDNDLKAMSKILGKASQNVIKVMMNSVKGGKYDALDLSRGIGSGDVDRMHGGEAEFLRSLWLKVRDQFRRYSKGKLRN